MIPSHNPRGKWLGSPTFLKPCLPLCWAAPLLVLPVTSSQVTYSKEASQILPALSLSAQ